MKPPRKSFPPSSTAGKRSQGPRKEDCNRKPLTNTAKVSPTLKLTVKPGVSEKKSLTRQKRKWPEETDKKLSSYAKTAGKHYRNETHYALIVPTKAQTIYLKTSWKPFVFAKVKFFMIFKQKC